MMNKEVAYSLAWGGGIVLLALAASFARGRGYIDDEAVTRIVLGATGLMVAAWGNRMPKALAPSATAARLSRVAGWSLAVSGLIYAGLWTFAPIPVAIAGGCGAIILGIAVTFGYCLSLRDAARAG